MRKLLLNSSQVSVLASAFIVILCTFALFLSGYAIQQRTVRQLRASIRPRESPQVHLPERFKTTTVLLDDGTTAVLESEAERLIQEQRVAEEALSEAAAAAAAEGVQAEKVEAGVEARLEARWDDTPSEVVSGSKATRRQMEMMEMIKARAAQKSWAVENPDPMARDRLPVSRAQRRKMIKDEIQRLAHSEEPVVYQRRLW